MSRGLAALVAVLFLATCAIPGTLQAHRFTTGFKAGETIRYQVHTVVSGSLSLKGQQVPLLSGQSRIETLQVVSVDGAGTATVRATNVDGVGDSTFGTVTGRPAPATFRIGSDGKIRSGAAIQVAGRVPSIPGSDQLTPVLTDHPVKPGDSWDKRYGRTNPYGPGGFAFTSHSTYVRDEPLGGRDAALIESTVSGPIDFTIDFSRVPATAGQAAPPSERSTTSARSPRPAATGSRSPTTRC